MRADQPVWRTSSYSSSTGQCVEVADRESGAAVRDSKAPERGHLVFTGTDWSAFIHAVKNDQL